MSCLDSFYIAHFEERDDFIWVIEKGLLLNKANFSEKGNKIYKQKAASLNGKERRKLMILSI